MGLGDFVKSMGLCGVRPDGEGDGGPCSGEVESNRTWRAGGDTRVGDMVKRNCFPCGMGDGKSGNSKGGLDGDGEGGNSKGGLGGDGEGGNSKGSLGGDGEDGNSKGGLDGDGAPVGEGGMSKVGRAVSSGSGEESKWKGGRAGMSQYLKTNILY